MPGQTSSPSSGSPGPPPPCFHIVRGTTRPSIGASDEQRFGGRHRAVPHARGPIPLQLEDGELGGGGLALQRDRLAEAGQLRLGRLEVQRVLLGVDARQHVVLGGLEPRQREVVLGGLDRRVVDGVLQLDFRLLLADVFLELLPLGLLVDRLAQRHLAIELDDEVALLDGRPLRRDADNRQLAVAARGGDHAEELDGLDQAVQAERGRRRSGALRRHRGQRAAGLPPASATREIESVAAATASRAWRPLLGRQGDAYDSPPRRRDETAVRRREYSARERSACASHSNEDVSSPRRSCWRPASAWPVHGSPPSSGQPPPATGRSSAVPTAMASRPIPTC